MALEEFWWSGGPTAGPATAYYLRFRGSQNLSWTPSAGGDGKVWTFSGWFRRGLLTANYGSNQQMLSASATNIQFGAGAVPDDIEFPGYQTSSKYRDVSAWYNVCIICNTTLATATDRLQLWVNGTRVTGFITSTPPALNANLNVSVGSILQSIGLNFYGYMMQLYLIDGATKPASSFGYFDSRGVWVAKDYLGSFGSNGWKLDFDPVNFNTGSLTWADLSGNGNDWSSSWNPVTNNDILYPTNTWRVFGNMAARTYAVGNYNPFINYYLLSAFSQYQNNVLEGAAGLQGLVPKSGKYMLPMQQFFAMNPCWCQNGTAFSGIFFADQTLQYQFTQPGPFFGNTTYPNVGMVKGNHATGNPNQLLWCGNNTGGYVYTDLSQGGPNTTYKTVYFLDCDTGSGYAGQADTYNVVFATGRGLTDPPLMTWTPSTDYAWGIYGNSYDNTGGVAFGEEIYEIADWNLYNLSTFEANGWKLLTVDNLPAPALPATITGTFIGNASTNGPYVFTNCVPGAISYGTVNVTFGNRFSQSDVDFLSNGFKLRSANSNTNGVAVPFTVTTTHTDGEFFVNAGGPVKVPYGGQGVLPVQAIPN